MSKRSTNKRHANPNKEFDKPLVKILIQKVDEEDIKIFAVGHEALTESTMETIEKFGNDLLLIPEIRLKAPLHKQMNVPLFRVILQLNDLLLQTKYDLSENVYMSYAQDKIKELIINDINNFVKNQMENVLIDIAK
jgi:hypothetical protein